jgi:preprotein translocase subunit SecA
LQLRESDGTDIKLGQGIQELGGLLILGTERHEARRIDNQLRGRSGRQGDPGESQFFVSMEDELMRLFGGDRLKSMMERLKVPDDVPLENPLVSRSIESAQKKVEGRNFDTRRHVVQYDDVMNKHREIMYKRRQKILVKIAESAGKPAEESVKDFLHEEAVEAMIKDVLAIVEQNTPGEDEGQWNYKGMLDALTALHPQLGDAITEDELKRCMEREKLSEVLTALVTSFYAKKCEMYPVETVRRAERIIVLQSIDTHWMDHIDTMAHLREQVAFSGYAQRDPLIEYQDQGFHLFQKLITAIASTMVRVLLQADFNQFAQQQIVQQPEENLQTNEDQIEENLQSTVGVNPIRPVTRGESSRPRKAAAEKVGRNDPCPCGSGKKYKKCHGKDE